MSKRTLALGLILLGVIAAVVSLAADALRLGNYPGINEVQILGAAIGGLVALLGAWLALRKPK